MRRPVERRRRRQMSDGVPLPEVKEKIAAVAAATTTTRVCSWWATCVATTLATSAVIIAISLFRWSLLLFSLNTLSSPPLLLFHAELKRFRLKGFFFSFPSLPHSYKPLLTSLLLSKRKDTKKKQQTRKQYLVHSNFT